MLAISRIFLFSLLFTTPFFVSANEKMTVTPAFQDIDLQPGESITREITIQNLTTTDQEFNARSVSFQFLDKSGGVAFLGTDINNNDLPPAPFITFENNTLSIPAGETKVFSFQIQDQESLAPGGHYAAVVFQTLPVTDEDSSQKIAVRQIFSSLIFLEKKGGEVKKLELLDYPVKKFLWSYPKDMQLTFKNTGNSHVTPRGLVEGKTIFGGVGSRTVINEASSILLPEQERAIPVSLEYQPLIPGFYTITASYRFDGQEDFQTKEQSFFLLPYRTLFIASILALVLILLKKKGLLRKDFFKKSA